MNYFNGTRMRWITDPPKGSHNLLMSVEKYSFIVRLPYALYCVNRLR